MIKMTRKAEELSEMCEANRKALTSRLREALVWAEDGKFNRAALATELAEYERKALESNQKAWAAEFFFGGADA
jgi:hypothetical protein